VKRAGRLIVQTTKLNFVIASAQQIRSFEKYLRIYYNTARRFYEILIF